MAEPSIHQEPFFAEGTEAMVALEAMVDAAGLRNVVWALAHDLLGQGRTCPSCLAGRSTGEGLECQRSDAESVCREA